MQSDTNKRISIQNLGFTHRLIVSINFNKTIIKTISTSLKRKFVCTIMYIYMRFCSWFYTSHRITLADSASLSKMKSPYIAEIRRLNTRDVLITNICPSLVKACQNNVGTYHKAWFFSKVWHKHVLFNYLCFFLKCTI